MPITINGTTGISGVDGSAGTPSIQGSDTNTGVFFPAADTAAITTGGAERVRVDSSGNVGIGTSSPGAKLDVNGSIKGTITSGTAVNSTSGTVIDFTGIPSWAKRITVMLNGVSLSGAANPVVQIGTSSGVETTGYSSITTSVTTTNNTTRGTTSTAYFQLQFNGSAPFTQTGSIVLSTMGSNIWVASGLFYAVGGVACDSVAGAKTLGGTLDRVRITTTNGTDTFDAGSINILYQG